MAVQVNKEMAAMKRTVAAGALVLFSLVTFGCGGGGGSNSSVNAVVPGTSSAHSDAASAFTYTGDDYGMQSATYLAATSSPTAIVLRAAIASGLTDPNFRTTVRIDINQPAAVTTGATYSLGSAAPGATAFPGTLLVFDGHASTLLDTVAGTISFSSFGTKPGDPIAGSFTATIKDGNDGAGSTYTVSANFSFSVGSDGPVTPAATPIPAGAPALYDTNCAGCHSLGSYDPSSAGAADVALKGGKLRELMVPDVASHQGIRLTASEIAALKILLNAH